MSYLRLDRHPRERRLMRRLRLQRPVVHERRVHQLTSTTRSSGNVHQTTLATGQRLCKKAAAHRCR